MSEESPADKLRNRNVDDEPELDLWSGGFSGKSMIGSWIGAAAVTLVVVILVASISALRSNSYVVWGAIGLVLLMWAYLVGIMIYRKLGIHYHLTTQELKHREGILFRKIGRIELIDIDDVNYQQGPIQALMKVGNLSVKSSDASHPELIMYGIADIANVADLINDARRKERRSRGLHIESI